MAPAMMPMRGGFSCLSAHSDIATLDSPRRWFGGSAPAVLPATPDPAQRNPEPRPADRAGLCFEPNGHLIERVDGAWMACPCRGHKGEGGRTGTSSRSPGAGRPLFYSGGRLARTSGFNPVHGGEAELNLHAHQLQFGGDRLGGYVGTQPWFTRLGMPFSATDDTRRLRVLRGNQR
jgi:hypothetical protein